jgi:hypothetical protein
MANDNIQNNVFLDYASGAVTANVTLESANQIVVYPFTIPYALKITNITFFVAAGDDSHPSDIGIYDLDGNLLADAGAQYISSTGPITLELVNGPIVLGPGTYLFAVTSAGTTLTFGIQKPGFTLTYFYGVMTGSSSGSLPSSITLDTGWGEEGDSPYIGCPPLIGLS